MEIIYMKQVQENPVLEGFKNRGFSIEKISEIEEVYNQGNKFPIAFREFLFLAGEFNNIDFDLIDDMLGLQSLIREELEDVNLKVERPFFAFDVYDSQYSVIFLDEDKEDPQTYIISPYAAAEGESLIKQNDWFFSEMVNRNVERVKNNLPL